MKYADLTIRIFWLVVGLLISILSTSYPIGSLTRPGPGLFPFILGLLLIFLSLILLLLGEAKKATLANQKAPPLFGEWKRLGYTVLILLLATFFFETIGYLFTLFFLLFVLMLGGRSQSWKTILLIALLSTIGVYLVFVFFLNQQLPRGFLGI